MRPSQAIAELEKLKAEAANPSDIEASDKLAGWKARVRLVIVRALGEKIDIVVQLDKIPYRLTAYFMDTPASEHAAARHAGVRKAISLIEAAIYELDLISGDAQIDEHAFDADLWAHVRQQVEDGDWFKVASQTAIFVENHIRNWADNPTDAKGDALVGKNLYAEVFSDTSAYKLGAQANEHGGWRFLAMGFASALGNVDRHRIQNRADAKPYAIGVLGLGSLLLTQMRHEHASILKPGP